MSILKAVNMRRQGLGAIRLEFSINTRSWARPLGFFCVICLES